MDGARQTDIDMAYNEGDVTSRTRRLVRAATTKLLARGNGAGKLVGLLRQRKSYGHSQARRRTARSREPSASPHSLVPHSPPPLP